MSRCARCGKIQNSGKQLRFKHPIPPTSITSIVFIGYEGWDCGSHDLCNDCWAAYEDFIDGKKVEGVQKADRCPRCQGHIEESFSVCPYCGEKLGGE